MEDRKPVLGCFIPSELTLPYQEWEKCVESKRAILTDDAWKWLTRWNDWDFACSPRDDNERRLIRLGHYLGWFDHANRRDDAG